MTDTVPAWPSGPVRVDLSPVRAPLAPPFRADVQGLRALAVLLVVAGHVLGVPAGGHVGVDVFFVVSGFLLTGLLVAEHERTGRLDVRAFYARRVRRLLPAGVLALAVTNLVAWFVFSTERAAQTLTDAGWALAFAANVRFADLGTDYFDATRPLSPVQHFWSLAVEEQFYLVWPCLLLALLTLVRRRALVLGAVLALSAASFVQSVRLTSAEPVAAYFATSARAWELGAGALLALLAAEGLLPRPGRRTATALVWLGLGGIAGAALLLDPTTPYPGTAAALPVAATLLVLLGGSGGSRNRLLDNVLSAWLGRLSYSLYLWHWPTLVLGAALLAPGSLRTAVVLGVTLALAAASLHLVEDPVRRSSWLLRRPAPSRQVSRRAVRAAVSGAVAAALLGGGWVLPAVALRTAEVAAPAREPAADSTADVLRRELEASLAPAAWPPLDVPLAALSHAGAPEWISDRCDNVSPGNVERCRYGDPAAPRTAALVGDSMATSWLPALREVLEPQGWTLHVLTRNQCPLPSLELWREHPSQPYTACADHRTWALEQVRRLQPDLVLASHSITMLDHQVGEPVGAARFPPWQRGLADSLTALTAAADRVVVLGPPPRSGNLQSCVHRLSAPADCTLELSGDWIDLRTAERAAAAGTGAQYLDVEPLFCSGGRCPAVVGSTPVYTDGRHLTAAYARRLAPRLAELLEVGASRSSR